MSDERLCRCGRQIPESIQRRSYCSDRCRVEAFRARQTSMGRKRTKQGYADGLPAWEAREMYGQPA